MPAILRRSARNWCSWELFWCRYAAVFTALLFDSPSSFTTVAPTAPRRNPETAARGSVVVKFPSIASRKPSLKLSSKSAPASLQSKRIFSAAPAVPTSIVFLWPMAHPCARTRTVSRTTCAFSESPDALASRQADPDGCLRSSRRQLSLGDQVCPSIACAGRITRPDCINPA